MNAAIQNITIRPASAQDWPQVLRLLDANGLAADDLQQPHGDFLLAWAADEAIGVAGAEPFEDAALIRAVSVAKPHQGTGVGRQLLERLIANLRQQGLRRAYAFTVTSPEYFAQFKFKRMPHEQAPAALRASAEFERACSACTALMSLPLSEDRPGGAQTVAARQPVPQASACCAPAAVDTTSTPGVAGKAACCGPSSTADAKPAQRKCCG